MPDYSITLFCELIFKMITFILLILPIITISAPVRTILCCCGCTEEPCPLVGPDCPSPYISCSAALQIDPNMVMCSTLQRLFEISQIPVEEHVSSPNMGEEMENSVKLLPTLESKDVENIKHDIMAIATNFTRKPDIVHITEVEPKKKPNSLHRMTQMVNELEGMLQMLRDEMSDQAASEKEVDATIGAKGNFVMVKREKREKSAEMENCNDEKLRKLIKENIKKDAKSSKREIQKAANKEFGGHFNVICSPCEFSFVVASQKYCDGFKDEVACFAFLQPPTKLKLTA